MFQGRKGKKVTCSSEKLRLGLKVLLPRVLRLGAALSDKCMQIFFVDAVSTMLVCYCSSVRVGKDANFALETVFLAGLDELN